MTTATAYIAVTRLGFVDGACFAVGSKRTARWIAEMGAAGLCVTEADRLRAKDLLFTTLPMPAGVSSGYGRMIVARRENGEVEAAGWDCAETRADAKEWLGRGLSLELVAATDVARLGDVNPAHVFATHSPAGEVLTKAQAFQALDGY